MDIKQDTAEFEAVEAELLAIFRQFQSERNSKKATTKLALLQERIHRMRMPNQNYMNGFITAGVLILGIEGVPQ